MNNNILSSMGWFQQETQFIMEFEDMEFIEMNWCLSNFWRVWSAQLISACLSPGFNSRTLNLMWIEFHTGFFLQVLCFTFLHKKFIL